MCAFRRHLDARLDQSSGLAVKQKKQTDFRILKLVDLTTWVNGLCRRRSHCKIENINDFLFIELICYGEVLAMDCELVGRAPDAEQIWYLTLKF